MVSLRRLRLGSDGRYGPTDKARLDNERFTVMGRDEGESQKEELPKLDKVTVSCEMELKGTGDILSMTMEVVGQDVIGGLMDLVKLGIIDKPARWWPTYLLQGAINSIWLRGDELLLQEEIMIVFLVGCRKRAQIKFYCCCFKNK